MQTPTTHCAQGAPPACPSHPDQPARLVCQKLDRRFCEECAVCPRPTYCKFRTQCLIRQMEDAQG
ncbi:MAG: hypothetical protein FJ313_04390 [Gemmatimonadetes bacterium]|nr:hypothetical protein [Gemmatimonadota bacterium]